MGAEQAQSHQGVDQVVGDHRVGEDATCFCLPEQFVEVHLVDDLLLEGEVDAPLVGERGVGHRPAVAEAADEVVVGDEDPVEEHLVELGLVGDLSKGAHLDAVGGEVDDHVREAPVPGRPGVGPHEGDAPAGHGGVGGPDLLPGHIPATVDPLGDGAQCRQVGSCVGLAEQLAPDLAGIEDRRQPPGPLRLGAVRQQGRADQVDSHPVHRLRGARPRILGVEQRHLDRRGVASPIGRRPGDPDPPVGRQAPLPPAAPSHALVEGAEVGATGHVGSQPGTRLLGERLLLG